MTIYEFPRDALCRGMDTELWFPVGAEGSPGYERTAAPARAVCALCPVRVDCLVWAMTHGIDEGIYGGLGPQERRVLRRRRAA